MSKIIVEDYTKPISKEDMINGLVSIIFSSAVDLGSRSGLETKDIILSVIQAGEEMVQYLLLSQLITEEEIKELYNKAKDNTKNHMKKITDSGILKLKKNEKIV